MQSRGALTRCGLRVMRPLGEQLPHWVCMLWMRSGGAAVTHSACASIACRRLANTSRARSLYQSCSSAADLLGRFAVQRDLQPAPQQAHLLSLVRCLNYLQYMAPTQIMMAFATEVLPRCHMRTLSAEGAQLLVYPAPTLLNRLQYFSIAGTGRSLHPNSAIGVDLDQYALHVTAAARAFHGDTFAAIVECQCRPVGWSIRLAAHDGNTHRQSAPG